MDRWMNEWVKSQQQVERRWQAHERSFSSACVSVQAHTHTHRTAERSHRLKEKWKEKDRREKEKASVAFARQRSTSYSTFCRRRSFSINTQMAKISREFQVSLPDRSTEIRERKQTRNGQSKARCFQAIDPSRSVKKGERRICSAPIDVCRLLKRVERANQRTNKRGRKKGKETRSIQHTWYARARVFRTSVHDDYEVLTDALEYLPGGSLSK